jgi:hypothetical protein
MLSSFSFRRYASSNRTPRGNRRATYQSLEAWNAENNEDVKPSIERIFEDTHGWQVINPAGDGFCGLYAVDLGNQFINSSEITEDGLVHPTKEGLLDHVIGGIEIYAKTRKDIIDALAKYSGRTGTLAMYSGRAGNEALIERITNAYIYMQENTENAGRDIAVQNVEQYLVKNLLIDYSLNLDITKMLISMLEEMPSHFKNKPINDRSYFDFNIYDPNHFDKVQVTDIKKQELNALLDQGNVDIFFISFLAYYYQRNFIVLFYDSRAAPDQRFICNSVTYINYLIDYYDKNIKNHSITFNSRNYSAAVSQTSLLFNNGHYVLFHHRNFKVREKLISKFMTREYDVDNPWEVWGWGTWQDSGPTAPLVMDVLPAELTELGAGIKKRKKRGKKQKQRLTQRQQLRQRQQQKQTQRQRLRQRQPQKQTQRPRQPRRTR